MMEPAVHDRPGASSPVSTPVVVVLAARRDRLWVTVGGGPGIVVHGRTLRQLQASAQAALELQPATVPGAVVQLRPQSAELEALADARSRYQTALRTAVKALRASGTSWTDIAHACQVRISDAQDHVGPDD